MKKFYSIIVLAGLLATNHSNTMLTRGLGRLGQTGRAVAPSVLRRTGLSAPSALGQTGVKAGYTLGLGQRGFGTLVKMPKKTTFRSTQLPVPKQPTTFRSFSTQQTPQIQPGYLQALRNQWAQFANAARTNPRLQAALVSLGLRAGGTGAYYAMGQPVLAEKRNKRLKAKYKAPSDLADSLDNAYNTDESFRHCMDDYMERTCKHPSIPYFVKKVAPMHRLEGLERIKGLIAEHNLTHVILPKKFVWRDWIVAEEIEPKRDSNGKTTLVGITKDQLRELILLNKKLGFWDFRGGNIGLNVFLSKQDPSKVAIIDTKTSSFEEHPHKKPIYPLIDMMTGSKSEDPWGGPSKLARKMQEEGDVDENFIPKDLDAFWEKYGHYFQEGQRKKGWLSFLY